MTVNYKASNTEVYCLRILQVIHPKAIFLHQNQAESFQGLEERIYSFAFFLASGEGASSFLSSWKPVTSASAGIITGVFLSGLLLCTPDGAGPTQRTLD